MTPVRASAFERGYQITPDAEKLLKEAYRRGGQERVRSLRRDAHPRGRECWLRATRFCLSLLAADA